MIKINLNESTYQEVAKEIENRQDIDTTFRTYTTLTTHYGKKYPVYIIYVEYRDVAEDIGSHDYQWVLAGYTDNGVLYLTADEIRDYNLNPYMDGEVIIDLEGMIKAFPEQFYIETLYSNEEKKKIFDAWYEYCINNMPKSRNELPRGNYTEYDDDLYNYWAGELRNKGISWQ